MSAIRNGLYFSSGGNPCWMDCNRLSWITAKKRRPVKSLPNKSFPIGYFFPHTSITAFWEDLFLVSYQNVTFSIIRLLQNILPKNVLPVMKDLLLPIPLWMANNCFCRWRQQTQRLQHLQPCLQDQWQCHRKPLQQI